MFALNSLLLYQNQQDIQYTYIRPRGVSNGNLENLH